jgi:hypothetical protein
MIASPGAGTSAPAYTPNSRSSGSGNDKRGWK